MSVFYKQATPTGVWVNLLFWLALSSAQLMAHPEFDAQIDALTTQLKEQPANAELYLSRADVHRQHAEFGHAFADLAMAGRLKPGWSKVLLVRARIFFDAGRYQQAARTLEEFLTTEPIHAPALLLRGRCHLKLGQREAAIEDYSAALKAFAQPNPELFVERAQIQASMGRFDEALRGLDEGCKRLGQAPVLQQAAIEFERQRGSFDAALSRTEQLLEVVREPNTLLLRAGLLEQAGRLREAQKGFLEILALTNAPGVRFTEAFAANLELARNGLARVEIKLSRLSSQVRNASPPELLNHAPLTAP